MRARRSGSRTHRRVLPVECRSLACGIMDCRVRFNTTMNGGVPWYGVIADERPAGNETAPSFVVLVDLMRWQEKSGRLLRYESTLYAVPTVPATRDILVQATRSWAQRTERPIWLQATAT